jgi:hypothetical protein
MFHYKTVDIATLELLKRLQSLHYGYVSKKASNKENIGPSKQCGEVDGW